MGPAENERTKKLLFRYSQTRPGIGNPKKIVKKIQKRQYGFFSSKNGTGEAMKEGEKKPVTIQSNPTWTREF